MCKGKKRQVYGFSVLYDNVVKFNILIHKRLLTFRHWMKHRTGFNGVLSLLRAILLLKKNRNRLK